MPGLLSRECCAQWLGELAPQGNASLRLAELARPDAASVLARCVTPALRQRLHERLGPAPRCLLSQCWRRRQHPSRLRPAGEHPHSWHQDGALALDFLRDTGAGLLDMLVCWVPLVDCGVDAPGLQWWALPTPALLRPEELLHEALCRRYGTATLYAPALAAGEALLFDGTLLHRTFVHDAMTRSRTSIELRFLPAGPVPRRLQGELLVALP